MDFTNINDPAGVKALLERLRSSQAWQDTLQTRQASSSSLPSSSTNAVSLSSDPSSGSASSTSETHDDVELLQRDTMETRDASGRSEDPKYDALISPPSSLLSTGLSTGSTSDFVTSASSTLPTSTPPGPSVASLLSQLQAYIPSSISPVPDINSDTNSNSAISPYRQPNTSASAFPPNTRSSGFDHKPGTLAPDFTASSSDSPFPSHTPQLPPPNLAPSDNVPRPDVRNYTFQQALPVVAQLAGDPKFVEAIAAMKQEQADLENKLWNDRNAIIKSQEEKVKLAKTKATMIGGAGLTQFEADNMNTAFKRELAKFDSERVLPAWDGLLSKQQTALENLGVPTMFTTTTRADRERQQRVVQVLSGFEN